MASRPSETDIPELRIDVESLLSHRTRQGVVTFTAGDFKTQMTPAKARELAGMIYEAAEAADSDALFWGWSTGALGLDEEVALQALRQFRALRAVKWKKEAEDDAARQSQG